VVVDDSIVRGTTSRKIVKMLRDAGAKEIHMRISSPPTKWPCYYGVDTPTRAELIAASHSVDEINQYITSDSLAYLSIEKMVHAVTKLREPEAKLQPPPKPNGKSLPVIVDAAQGSPFCHACWSGEYPIEFTQHPRVRQMRLLDL
jgi:amidophosphoribosyltransferase